MMTPSTLTFSPTCSRYTPGLTRVAPWLVGLTFWTLLASCTEEKKPSTPPPPPQVEVVEIVQKDVPIFREWVATTIGSQTAEIRGQVSGYLTKQNYKDGAFVKKGEALFEIDPRPLEAELMQAVGKFEQARGQLALAKATVTDTATVYISAAPTATVTGANYALWSAAGLNRFGGIVQTDAARTIRYVAKTSTYGIDATDEVVDCTSGTFTVTLPTAASITGRTYTIKNSGAGVVTIATTSGQKIDGADTVILNVAYQSITIVSDGSNWKIY